jgi:hypothetical protein
MCGDCWYGSWLFLWPRGVGNDEGRVGMRRLESQIGTRKKEEVPSPAGCHHVLPGQLAGVAAIPMTLVAAERVCLPL